MKTTPIHMIWALLPVLAAGCGTPQPTYNELMSEGRHEYASGRYTAAVTMFQKASDMDPERPEPAYEEGRCNLQLARQEFREDDISSALLYCDRAIAAYDRAVEAFPGYSRAIKGKADALRLKGQQEAALEITEWAVDASAHLPNLMVVNARKQAQVGEVDKAQLTFQKAITMEPENAALHAELGLLYLRCGNEAEAIRSLRRAYELNPGAPGVAASLSHLGALGDRPAARP